ncbi:hypothetical protein LY78DRAFT_143262 [Colletotrichum sublineola]|nr:hypothetical protein LY78DRAFT_143262 [Colletotrichum sublineola]
MIQPESMLMHELRDAVLIRAINRDRAGASTMQPGHATRPWITPSSAPLKLLSESSWAIPSPGPYLHLHLQWIY